MRCACIDIGSNTTRLLVADLDGGALAPVVQERAFTRLGRSCRAGGELPPEAVELIGALAPVGTFVTNYAIYPFVGLIEPGFAWVVQEREVAQVLELPLEAVRAGYDRRRLVRRGIPFRTDCYVVGEHLIWGATARIVADLLDRV